MYPSPDKEWNWPRDDTYDGRTGMSVEIYVSSPEPSRGAQARAPTECAPKIHLTVPGDGPPRTPLQQVHRTPPRAFTSVKQKVHFELEKCREVCMPFGVPYRGRGRPRPSGTAHRTLARGRLDPRSSLEYFGNLVGIGWILLGIWLELDGFRWNSVGVFQECIWNLVGIYLEFGRIFVGIYLAFVRNSAGLVGNSCGISFNFVRNC